MAALTASRNTPEWNGAPRYHVGLIGVEASTSIYVGSMVAIYANGYAVPAQLLGATPLNSLLIMGVCEAVYAGGIMPPGINATNVAASAALFPQITNLGTAGAISVQVRRRAIFGMDNDGTVLVTSEGQLVFANDDHTVSLTDGSGGTTVPNTTSIVVPAAAPLLVVLKPYIVPGSFRATSLTGGGGTVYVENTDYAIDYQAGLFLVLAGGAIAAGGTVFITYKYGKATKVCAGKFVQLDAGGQVFVDFGDQNLPSVQAATLAN
jgi:hypothetical protein